MKSSMLRFSVELEAPVQRVWDALTRPELVKQYFFGTDVETDWKKGSPIYFRGTWDGKSYEDKGTILDVTPGERVSYSYWSALSGSPDRPENYRTVTYEVEQRGSITVLTLTQDNANEEAKQHSADNWKMIFEGLRKLVEGTGQK